MENIAFEASTSVTVTRASSTTTTSFPTITFSNLSEHDALDERRSSIIPSELPFGKTTIEVLTTESGLLPPVTRVPRIRPDGRVSPDHERFYCAYDYNDYDFHAMPSLFGPLEIACRNCLRIRRNKICACVGFCVVVAVILYLGQRY